MKRRSFLAMLMSLPFMAWARTPVDGILGRTKYVGMLDEMYWLPEYPILYQYSEHKGPNPCMGVLDVDNSPGIEEYLVRVTLGERHCGCAVSHYEVWCREQQWQEGVQGDADGFQWTHVLSINKPYIHTRTSQWEGHRYEFVAVYMDGGREQVPYLVSPPKKVWENVNG
jgi:hypothetical protein